MGVVLKFVAPTPKCSEKKSELVVGNLDKLMEEDPAFRRWAEAFARESRKPPGQFLFPPYSPSKS